MLGVSRTVYGARVPLTLAASQPLPEPEVIPVVGRTSVPPAPLLAVSVFDDGLLPPRCR